ncbi:DUF2188 domain-containing protein [Legionella hackeliae]|uniref:DUF2188 domain-containing protein n=1 Tax=Legionella hackeliae TaxID=449 RepID=A0A0A8UWS0_LEGHA|nr:DUF2188 domain-containing protein [Legionella hackeliae]KTD13137.1 hypothetical protein Lhac_1006 [Legionella hackeliae]CEK11552.1 conserved protein of unknown function [Legionella hackeliae]STX48323.1 Uncharacterised protein [Legionella hackeliae]
MNTNDYHVVPNNKIGGSDVKREQASRASRHFETQQKAIDAARKMSRRERTELFIHGMDGKILRRDSHGHDPVSSKG